jgi:hypothetical protein
VTDPLAANPFSVLTFIAAPAVLTNATAVMGLMTANRIARIVDRTRVVSALLQTHTCDSPALRLLLRELHVSAKRGKLLVRALTGFYTGVAAFAAASLVSLLGMVLLLSGFDLLTRVAIGIGLAFGTVALGGLISGASLLVWETRLALAILHETTEFACRLLPPSTVDKTAPLSDNGLPAEDESLTGRIPGDPGG